MLTLLAAIVVFACVMTTFRRLRTAVAPTPLDPKVLLQVLRGESAEKEAASRHRLTDAGARTDTSGRERVQLLRRAILSVPHADWEHTLFDALEHPPDESAALINEQLSELDFRVAHWQRAPKVCARICASTGFLFAALSMIDSLSGLGPLEGEARDAFVRSSIVSALDAATLGMCGAAFCAAAAVRAQRAARGRLEATEKLVAALERLTAPPERGGTPT